MMQLTEESLLAMAVNVEGKQANACSYLNGMNYGQLLGYYAVALAVFGAESEAVQVIKAKLEANQ